MAASNLPEFSLVLDWWVTLPAASPGIWESPRQEICAARCCSSRWEGACARRPRMPGPHSLARTAPNAPAFGGESTWRTLPDPQSSRKNTFSFVTRSKDRDPPPRHTTIIATFTISQPPSSIFWTRLAWTNPRLVQRNSSCWPLRPPGLGGVRPQVELGGHPGSYSLERSPQHSISWLVDGTIPNSL